MSGYRPEFEAAMLLFAAISEAMARKGFSRPILVGGAAVELWTTSEITTGDFDICTPSQPEFEEIMRSFGFIRPSGPGVLIKGWIHPISSSVSKSSPTRRWTAMSILPASA